MKMFDRSPARASARLILLLLAAMVPIGCVTPGTPRLQSVVKGNRVAVGAELQAVRVTRAGADLTTASGMVLKKGDRIVTDSATSAVLLFGDAYEVILGPETSISISPDFFVDFGKAVVKKLKEIRKKFQAETKYVNAGVEHTEFAISVDPGDVVSVVVREGSVTLESTTKSWPTQTIRAREGALVRAGEPPSRRERVPQSELDRTFGWADRVERIVTIVMPDLNEQLLNDARRELVGAGLKVGRIQKVAADGRRLDIVVGQSIPGGQPVRSGTSVDLRVTGESVVPDLTNMTRLQAGIAISFAELTLGETTEEETEARAGRVMRQSPPPGTRVAPGTAVSIVIARRPNEPNAPNEPTEATRPNPRHERVRAGCTVPNLSRLSKVDAQKALDAAGLSLGDYPDGGGNSQNPPPGTSVPCGTSVSVTNVVL
jgi:beta-lactam-binding protein with PASTA domain